MRLVLLLSAIWTSVFGAPIQLTDVDFEKLTQATTGSTTGRWFIGFFKDACGHCKKMKPAWEELSNVLEGEYNIASVDVAKNPKIAKRFSVNGYPSLFVIEKGIAYQYSGERSVEALTAFVTEGFLVKDSPKVKRQFKIPSEPTAAQAAIQNLNSQKKVMTKDIQTRPIVVASYMGIGFLMGVFLGFSVCLCMPRKTQTEKKRD